MNIPIYRAKKIDSDEYVVGWLKTCTDTGVILWIQTKKWKDYKIDETTLKISFDNGKTWKTFKEVQIALGDK